MAKPCSIKTQRSAEAQRNRTRGTALLGWPCCLIAVVHEAAATALAAKVWIGDGRALLIGREAAGEQGIGLEFGRATVELADMAQDDAGAAVHGADDAADANVHVFVFAEFAYLVVIFPVADEGEAAEIVFGIGRADIEEAGAVGELDDVVDVGGDADFLVEVFGGLVGGDAGLLSREGGGGCAEEEAEGEGAAAGET